MITIIQIYLLTVIFWLVLFASGEIELYCIDRKTKETNKADVWLKIIYSFGWLIIIPLTVIKEKWEETNENTKSDK